MSLFYHLRMDADARMLSFMKRLGVALILLLALCGLADSVYIAQHEASGTPLLCNVGNLSGCNIVAQSPYSKVLGIPLAEYGIFFYAIIFILSVLELFIFDQLLRRALQALSAIGLLASICFTLLQVFVINALCIYCLGSAVVALLIFLLAASIEPVHKDLFRWPKSNPPPPPPPPLRMPPPA